MSFLRAGDTGIDMTVTSSSSPQFLTFTEQTPTTLVADYRRTGQPGHVVSFNGVDLSGDFASGLARGEAGQTPMPFGVVSGTLKELRETLDGTLLFEVTGFAVPATSLFVTSSGRVSHPQFAPVEVALLGDDTVQGGAGDDVLRAGGGSNVILGGSGYDTAIIAAPFDSGSPQTFVSTFSYRFRDEAVVSHFQGVAGRQVEHLFSVEAVRFSNETIPQAAFEAARPFQYLATYSDLAAAYGADEVAGWRHFAGTGLAEGRSATFSGLSYIASYGDLRATYGTDAEAGAQHFLVSGRAEGREITFDAWQYLAANSDLRTAFGNNLERATSHYIQDGAAEGRVTGFDGLRYIASYGDLIRVLPETIDTGAMHFISFGAAEGRAITFDPLRYIASYRDLVGAFGADEARGLQHWLSNGFAEGRTATVFNADQYLSNYADLRAAFGTDARAATLHWVQTGMGEGRTYSPIT